MKKAGIVLCVLAALLAVAVPLALLLRETEPEINNTAPADSIITEEYNLERLMLVEAVYRVRSGFRDVTAKALADETGVTLECKRQTGPDSFYYILSGDGYRCFVFVDRDNVVGNVMLARQFATRDEIAQTVAELSLFGDKMLVDETQEYRDSFYICCSAVGCDYLYFPLSDGVMIMRRPHLYNDADAPAYYYYTDEEWPDAVWEAEFSAWNRRYEILPLDKAPW